MAAQSQTCRSRLLRVYRIIVKSSMESRQSRQCCQGFDSTQSELSFLFFRVEIYVPDLLHNPLTVFPSPSIKNVAREEFR